MKSVDDKKKKTNDVKASKKDEGVKVKEIKVTTVDEYYEDDKKLIVIISIAVLIIIAVIVCLLVGCQKQEQDEPNKPNDDVVIPVDDNEDDTGNEQEIVVKKVTTKTTKKDNVVKDETKYFSVMFDFGDIGVKYLQLEEDSIVSPYVPKGYSSCEYFMDEDLTIPYNFKKRLDKDSKIYGVCKVDKYSVEYDFSTSNITEYSVDMGEVNLVDAISVEGKVFLGWYLDQEYTNEVTTLSKNIISYAKNNVIKLYARFDTLSINYYDNDNTLVYKENYDGNNTINENISGSVCVDGTFLGWTDKKDSKVIKYNKGQSIGKIRNDLDLYPVCGSATVVYTSEGNEVTLGYTDEDLEEYNLPKPSEVGLETPKYVIPVDTKTSTSKVVVPDEAIEVLEGEIKLGDAISKAGEGYIPQVGDNVEEHNKVFVGWKEKEEITDTTENDNLDTLVGEDNILPDDYVPEKENTELEAIWREQTEEEIESEIYDKTEEIIDEPNEDIEVISDGEIEIVVG